MAFAVLLMEAGGIVVAVVAASAAAVVVAVDAVFDHVVKNLEKKMVFHS